MWLNFLTVQQVEWIAELYSWTAVLYDCNAIILFCSSQLKNRTPSQSSFSTHTTPHPLPSPPSPHIQHLPSSPPQPHPSGHRHPIFFPFRLFTRCFGPWFYPLTLLLSVIDRCGHEGEGVCLAIPLLVWVCFNSVLVFIGALLVTCVEVRKCNVNMWLILVKIGKIVLNLFVLFLCFFNIFFSNSLFDNLSI